MSACGCAAPSGVAIASIALTPFHRLGGSETFSALTLARSVMNRPTREAVGSARRNIVEPSGSALLMRKHCPLPCASNSAGPPCQWARAEGESNDSSRIVSEAPQPERANPQTARAAMPVIRLML
ncbi:MAG: hypothetical protein BWZ10_03466 [candidate division BRC1 bacterium ADurb.BinA364]|nr:MAG: hypothetical protein BWZ10_03466 [candidate division BRC1 bacterium ADurb.BinA364]